MASAFSHAVFALALGKAVPPRIMNLRLWLLGVTCSVLPDVDAIGFQQGIPYDSLWGHRGLTHSLLFALILSLLLSAFISWKKPRSLFLHILVFLFVCTASHGVLDAMTNGGLGVAFFSPFDATRYFLPFRPITVSPISITGFFGSRGLRVLASEFVWIWMPSIGLFFVLWLIHKKSNASSL